MERKNSRKKSKSFRRKSNRRNKNKNNRKKSKLNSRFRMAPNNMDQNKRTVYILGENHTYTIPTMLHLERLKETYKPIEPLFFGEKGMELKYNYNIIEEDSITSAIGQGIYAYGGLCDYITEPRSREFYDILSKNLAENGFMENHVKSSLVHYRWINRAKQNLMTFIKKGMEEIGLPDDIQNSVVSDLNNCDYLSAISKSEEFRNINIYNKIENYNDIIDIETPFVVIVGLNHVENMINILNVEDKYKTVIQS